MRPDLVVIHYTAMPYLAAARDRLCDPATQVSAHYLIAPDGTVLMLVPETARAWHAGAGFWGGADDINSRSIGIELANDGASPFAAAQMAALEVLLAGVMARWQVRPERVIGHSDMAPDRKGDPGARFDWRRLAVAGLSVWPQEASVGAFDAVAFERAACAFGYPAAAPQVLLRAVRLRFRPWAAGLGAGDATDLAIITDLARRFAIDGARDGA